MELTQLRGYSFVSYPQYLSITIIECVFHQQFELGFCSYYLPIQNTGDTITDFPCKIGLNLTHALVYPYLKDNRYTTYSIILTFRSQNLVDTLQQPLKFFSTSRIMRIPINFNQIKVNSRKYKYTLPNLWIQSTSNL